MLGSAMPRRLDDPVTVSLEDFIPADNFYRHLEAKLDLGFVRKWTHDLYAERGHPSTDPVVFFKLQLVMFFEGRRRPPEDFFNRLGDLTTRAERRSAVLQNADSESRARKFKTARGVQGAAHRRSDLSAGNRSKNQR